MIHHGKSLGVEIPRFPKTLDERAKERENANRESKRKKWGRQTEKRTGVHRRGRTNCISDLTLVWLNVARIAQFLTEKSDEHAASRTPCIHPCVHVAIKTHVERMCVRAYVCMYTCVDTLSAMLTRGEVRPRERGRRWIEAGRQAGQAGRLVGWGWMKLTLNPGTI